MTKEELRKRADELRLKREEIDALLADTIKELEAPEKPMPKFGEVWLISGEPCLITHKSGTGGENIILYYGMGERPTTGSLDREAIRKMKDTKRLGWFSEVFSLRKGIIA